MKPRRTQNLIAAVLFGVLAFTTTIARAADALPSWKDGAAKASIVAFIANRDWGQARIAHRKHSRRQ